MSSWSNVSIHTENHTVLIPKQKFIKYSRIFGIFYFDFISNWNDLISIYCYKDGVVRFTFSNPEFEEDLDEDIGYILNRMIKESL